MWNNGSGEGNGARVRASMREGCVAGQGIGRSEGKRRESIATFKGNRGEGSGAGRDKEARLEDAGEGKGGHWAALRNRGEGGVLEGPQQQGQGSRGLEVRRA